MAVIVDAEFVKMITGIDASDAAIDFYINMINKKIGVCLSSSYDDETAKFIISNLIAHLVTSTGGLGSITAIKSPNGASVSYQAGNDGDGIRSTQFGRVVATIDVSGCTRVMFASPFILTTIGK